MRDRRGGLTSVRENEERLAAARTYQRRLIDVHEEERRRVSRQLNDQLGQTLTAVKMNLYALQQHCGTAEMLSAIRHNLEVIDVAIDQVRDLSVDLRPLVLDDLGLAVALRWFLDRQARRYDIEIEFTCSFNEEDRFSWELETACFRIVQEAVTNVVKHANATRIAVKLERTAAELILSISDDGAGFDLNALPHGERLGLQGMDERTQAVGGSLTINSALAAGTEICARFPIDSQADDSFAAALCDVTTSSALP